MTLEISPNQERRLRVLAESQGREAQELLEELVEDGLSKNTANENANGPETDTEKAQRQRAALREFLDEIKGLPQGNPDDGFDSSRHDEVIYRKDW